MRLSEKVAKRILSENIEPTPETIDRFCNGDSEASREVIQILQEQQRGDELLETLRKSFGADAASEFEPGQRFGKYELETRIGKGGFGEVWRARPANEENDNEPVVVKIAHEKNAELDLELSALRRVAEVEGVAKILDHGVAHDHHFLALEYVEGQTLAQILADQRESQKAMGSERALQLLLGISRTVAQIHESGRNGPDVQGMAHGDLTPANIIVRDQQPVLIDFGAAFRHRVSNDTVPVDSKTIPSRPLCFTPDYRVPEVMYGVRPTMSADVYQIGLIAFELLTGDRYTRVCESGREKQGFETIIRKSGKSTAEVIRRCLQWKPSDRFASASELVTALERNGEDRWLARHHYFWGLGALVLVIFMAFSTWALTTTLFQNRDQDPAANQLTKKAITDSTRGFTWTGDIDEDFEKGILEPWWDFMNFDVVDMVSAKKFANEKEEELRDFVDACDQWLILYEPMDERLARRVHRVRAWSNRLLEPLRLRIITHRDEIEGTKHVAEVLKNGTSVKKVSLDELHRVEPSIPVDAKIYDVIEVRLLDPRGKIVERSSFTFLMAFNFGQKLNSLRFRFEDKSDPAYLEGSLITDTSLRPPPLPTHRPPVGGDAKREFPRF